MPVPEATQLRQQLSQIYQKLSAPRRQIVRLFSVAYEPVSRSQFLKCLNALDVKQDNGNAFNASALRKHLEYLLEQNLLIQKQGKSPQCNPFIAEIATRDAIKAGVWESMVKVIETHLPISTYYYGSDSRRFNSIEQLFREVRIGIYHRDFKFISRQLECYQKYSYSREQLKLEHIIPLLFNNPFDPYWFNKLPQELYELGLLTILLDSVMNLFDAEEQFNFLKAEAVKPKGRCSDNLRLLLTEQLILRDDLDSAQSCLEKVSNESQEPANVFWGWLAFLDGDYQQAIAYYTSALKSLKKASGKRRNVFFDSIAGIFFILALLQDGSPTSLKEAEGYATIMVLKSDSWLSYVYTWLQKLLLIQQGDMSQKEWINNASIADYQEHHSLETFFCSLCLYWVDQAQARKRTPRLLKFLSDQAESTGYYWLAAEAAELLSRLKAKGDKVEAIYTKTDEVPLLVDLIKPQPPLAVIFCSRGSSIKLLEETVINQTKRFWTNSLAT